MASHATNIVGEVVVLRCTAAKQKGVHHTTRSRQRPAAAARLTPQQAEEGLKDGLRRGRINAKNELGRLAREEERGNSERSMHSSQHAQQRGVAKAFDVLCGQTAQFF